MVSKEFSLNGKIALVAGDSKIWCKNIATALAGAEADVIVAAQDVSKINEAVAEVEQLGRKGLAILTDTKQADQVKKMIDQVVSNFGRIDIIVNATDAEFAKPMIDITENEWIEVINANLTSVFLCCQAAGKQMLKQKKGRIINLVSCLAERGMENGTAYCAAMGGILQITRALALEWGRHGITVNAVGTGWFADQPLVQTPQSDSLLKFLPLRRYGRPGEIGSMVVYLASDKTDFYTGQIVYVDGGATMRP